MLEKNKGRNQGAWIEVDGKICVSECWKWNTPRLPADSVQPAHGSIFLSSQRAESLSASQTRHCTPIKMIQFDFTCGLPTAKTPASHQDSLQRKPCGYISSLGPPSLPTPS